MLAQRDSLVARSEVDRIHRLQDDTFMRGCIPWWIAGVGYVVFAALAIIVIPFLYTPVKWWAPAPLSHLQMPDAQCMVVESLSTFNWTTHITMWAVKDMLA